MPRGKSLIVTALDGAALLRGPGDRNPPQPPWRVLSGKNEGITPGLEIEDARGRRYLIKFDPLSNPEMASAADAIGSKLFYALGYNTPENYIVRFRREQFRLTPESRIVDYRGKEKRMDERDLRDALQEPNAADSPFVLRR